MGETNRNVDLESTYNRTHLPKKVSQLPGDSVENGHLARRGLHVLDRDDYYIRRIWESSVHFMVVDGLCSQAMTAKNEC